MARLITVLLLTLAMFVAAGCGSDDEAFVQPPVVEEPEPPEDPDAEDPGPPVASLKLLTSTPQIPSDGALPAAITAQVQDINNNFVAGVTVSFAADSGGLSVAAPVTDVGGKASAELTTAGDPTNRAINVTGSVELTDGSFLTDTVTVDVIGTQLTINGQNSLVQGGAATYTVVLADADGNGIAGETITVTSSAGNTLSASSLTTDATGKAEFQLTATVAGIDSISVQALGLTGSRAITVSDDTFAFIDPDPNAVVNEIDLGNLRSVTVRWTQGGLPVSDAEIGFATTRGVLMPATATTDDNGEATVTIQSGNAGAAAITAATPDGGPLAQLNVEFVATVANSVSVQADPFNIAPNEQSTITAVVRDPNNNLVKNKTVVFQLEDVTGGSLSVGAAETDSQGRAQTFYTASSSTSASEGILVTAFVADDPSVTDSAGITVARREVFTTIGTGNEISEPNPAQYAIEFAVQASDADGNGVEGVDVQMSVLSVNYFKGRWGFDPLANAWFSIYTAGPCADEDINRNGLLDFGEDFNNSGQIEAGNVVVVSPGVATTDANGSVIVTLTYPQVYGTWLEVELEAKTEVQGSEFTESQSFLVTVAANDVNNGDTAPPALLVGPDPNPANELLDGGLVSPFGYSPSCETWDF